MLSSRCTVALLVLAFLASVSCAEGVTWIEINGQTDAVLETGQPISITMDCTPGGEVIASPFVDTNGNGTYDSADQPLGDPSLYVDNSPKDEDSRAGYLQQTDSPNVGMLVGKPILLVATEFGSGTTVSCRCVFQPAQTTQGVRGHLSNSDGTPAPGQTVWAAHSRNIDLDDPTDTPQLYAAVADQNGDFEINVPRSGCYLVGTGEGEAAWRPVCIALGAFVEGIELRLPAAEPECPGGTYTLSGTVTDAQDTPIPFVRITARDNNWSWQKDFFCDLQGNFSVSLRGGYVELDVRLNGYLQDEEYSLILTHDTTLNTTVHRAPYYVTGIARDSVTSEPLAEASVNVWGDFPPWAGGEDGASTSGRYLCWSDAGSLRLESGTWARGYERFTDTFTISGNTTRDIALTPMTAIVSGRVNDDRGQDVPYVYVEALNQSRVDAARATAFTNADGTYSLGLTPGDIYDIRFLRRGWETQTYYGLTAVSGEFTLDRTLTFISDAPVISGGGVTPTSGDSSTSFTFEVVYTDPNNDPPGSVEVYVDGISYSMSPADPTDTTYTDGARYVCSTYLSGGGHQYRFEAEDDHGAPSRVAQGERYEHQGPCVEIVTPANDNCADAIVLTPPASWTTDISGATVDAVEPSGCYMDMYHTVWYSYLASQTGLVNVTAVAKNYQWNAVLDIFQGECGGPCWETDGIEGGPNLRSIHILQANPDGEITVGWVVGDNGFIAYPDGSPDSGTTNDLFSVYGLDANLVWTAGEGGTILHSTDGGATWSPQTSGVTSTLRSAKFKNQDEGIALGDGGVILGTNNGGTSWMSMTSGTTANMNAFTGVPPAYDVLFAVGNSGTLLRMDVNVWSPVSVPSSANLRGITFGSSGSAWIVGDGGEILHSSDGGGTWIGQTSGVVTNLYSVQATSALECRAVGAGGVILHTQDGGQNWTKEAVETTADLYSLSLIGSQLGMACGANGSFALLKTCSPQHVACGYGYTSFVAQAGAKYLIRIGSLSTQAGLVDCTFSAASGETSIVVSPDPFTPNGCNTARITVTANPGQDGLKAKVHHPEFLSGKLGSLEISMPWDWYLDLTETPPGSGTYTADWDATDDLGLVVLAPDSNDVTICVVDSAGSVFTPTINLSVRGVASVTASPAALPHSMGHETTTITATTNASDPVGGLHLSAQVLPLWGESSAPVRALPMSEGPVGTYICTWDGKDEGGVPVRPGEYGIFASNTDCVAEKVYGRFAVVSIGLRGVGSGPVAFRGIVTAKFADCMFVEYSDRSVGVKVIEAPWDVNVGDEVVVAGDVSVVGGMKQIAPSEPVSVQSWDNDLPYLGMRLRDVGGKDYWPDGIVPDPLPDPIPDPGITDGRGPLNVGLFVTVNGMVTYRDTAATPTFFYIWDGSNMVNPGYDPSPLTDGGLRTITTDTAGNPIDPIEVPILGMRIADSGYLSGPDRDVVAWQDWVEIEGIVGVNQSAIPGKTIPEIMSTSITLKESFDTITSAADAAVTAGANLMAVPSVPAKTGNGIDYQYHDVDWIVLGYDLNPMGWEAQQVFGKAKWEISNQMYRMETANVSQYPFAEVGEPLGSFGGMLLGDSYWVYPADFWGGTAISYSGLNQSIPQWIATGQAGWLLIGHPQAHNSNMPFWYDNGTPTNYDDDYMASDVFMTDGGTVYNLEDVSGRGLNWLNTRGYRLDNQTQSQPWVGCENDVPDEIILMPWYGYCFETYVADKAWIIY